MTTKPEYQDTEEFQNRTRKLKELKELGIDPFPHKFTPTHFAKTLHEKYQDEAVGQSEEAKNGTTKEVAISGRLVLFRPMGKNAFAHILDETGRIQIMINRDVIHVTDFSNENAKEAPSKEEETLTPMKLIEKKLDLGDIIGIEGHLFRTKKGELTLFAKKLTLLCKTLLPLAEKHSGLHDKELRYRKRWLDLIVNDEVRETFKKRSRILTLIRKYLEDAEFIEVETPILQSIYGGAEAKPFMTNLHALNQDMYLRISLEIPLKKLVVGGMGKIFEMGRVFNEGIDRSHNPEFTLLEAYASYWDYNDIMSLMENLLETLTKALYNSTKLPAKHPTTGEDIEIETKAPWKRYSMKESIKKFANLDVDTLSDQELHQKLKESGHIDLEKLKTLSRGLMIAALFEIFVEPHLVQPHHITDHPIETTPLCKLHRDPVQKEQGIVERFESFVLCGELCNAYTELNDPELQKELLEQQAQRKEAGDEEASPFDEEFVEAICQGMPPTGGIGIGIDRLMMLLLNSHSIRDVLFFPWMKPL